MNEGLYRGKRKYNGEWVEGYYFCKRTRLAGSKEFISEKSIITPGIEEIRGAYGESSVLIEYEVIPESVEPCSGLTDSNGKKIFKGDIIRYADECDYRCYLESLECPEEYEGVDFSDLWTFDEVVYGIAIGYPAFDLNSHDWEENGLSHLSESGQYFYEVIGNIHDNPELLKGGAEG